MAIDDFDQQDFADYEDDDDELGHSTDEVDFDAEDGPKFPHQLYDGPRHDGPPRRETPGFSHRGEGDRRRPPLPLPPPPHHDHDDDSEDEDRPEPPHHDHPPHHGPPHHHHHHHGPPPPPPAWIMWIAEKLGVPPPPPPPPHHHRGGHHGPHGHHGGPPPSPPPPGSEDGEDGEYRKLRPTPFNGRRPVPFDAPPSRGQLFHHQEHAEGERPHFNPHHHHHHHDPHFLHSIQALFFVLAMAISTHWGSFIFFLAQGGLTFFVVRKVVKRIRERRERGAVRLEDEEEKEGLLEKNLEVIVEEEKA